MLWKTRQKSRGPTSNRSNTSSDVREKAIQYYSPVSSPEILCKVFFNVTFLVTCSSILLTCKFFLFLQPNTCSWHWKLHSSITWGLSTNRTPSCSHVWRSKDHGRDKHCLPDLSRPVFDGFWRCYKTLREVNWFVFILSDWFKCNQDLFKVCNLKTRTKL